MRVTKIEIAIIEITRRMSGKIHANLDKKLMITILSLGGFSILFGMFYQVLGLYQAYQCIMAADDISPIIVMGGVFVSFYAPLFGLSIGLISLVMWYAIRMIWDVRG